VELLRIFFDFVAGNSGVQPRLTMVMVMTVHFLTSFFGA